MSNANDWMYNWIREKSGRVKVETNSSGSSANNMDNVTTQDIKNIEVELNITLTKEQRDNVLKEFGRIVMDRGDDWDSIIKELITKQKHNIWTEMKS